jgi:hypothetical protein
MPVVIVPPPYRGPTGGAARIEVKGATLLECLDAVEDLHPGFRAQVLDVRGQPHRFVKLFLNREQPDQIEVVAAIAGG